MTCFMCKGTLKEGFSPFTTDMGNCVVIIKNVPSHICGQCGETVRRLEQIIQSLTGSADTEIAVVSYTAQAA